MPAGTKRILETSSLFNFPIPDSAVNNPDKNTFKYSLPISEKRRIKPLQI